MANSPPLPFGPGAIPTGANRGDPLAPGGFQLPPGIKIEHPLAPFPPDVQQALDAARRCGGCAITITINDPAEGDPDRLTTRLFAVGNFKADWLRRTWQTITNLCWTWGMNGTLLEHIRQAAAPVAAPKAPPPPASESAAAQG